MKKIFFYIFLLLFMNFELVAKTEIDKAFTKRIITNNSFFLYSPDIYEGREIRDEQIYDNFGCSGKNISPKLIWRNPPKGTKSFAITMYDKDVNTGSGWWNWILYNIPPDATLINDNASKIKKYLPKGTIQAINDYGYKKYGGACPELDKKNNYIITIYALNISKLNVPRKATPAMVSLFIHNYTISTATIRAYYRRHNNLPEVILKNNTNIKNLSENKEVQKNNLKENKEKEVLNLKNTSSKNSIENKSNSQKNKEKKVYSFDKQNSNNSRLKKEKKSYNLKKNSSKNSIENKSNSQKNKEKKVYSFDKQNSNNSRLNEKKKVYNLRNNSSKNSIKNKTGKIKEYTLKSNSNKILKKSK